MKHLLWIGIMILLMKLNCTPLTTYLFFLKSTNETKESFIEKDKLKIPSNLLGFQFYEIIYEKQIEGFENLNGISISENSRYSAICSQNLSDLDIFEIKSAQNNASLIYNKYATYKEGFKTCHLFNIEDSLFLSLRNKIWGEVISSQNNNFQIKGFALSENGKSNLKIQIHLDFQQDIIILKYNEYDLYYFYNENNKEMSFSQNKTSTNYNDLIIEVNNFKRFYQKSGYHNLFETNISIASSKNIDECNFYILEHISTSEYADESKITKMFKTNVKFFEKVTDEQPSSRVNALVYLVEVPIKSNLLQPGMNPIVQKITPKSIYNINSNSIIDLRYQDPSMDPYKTIEGKMPLIFLKCPNHNQNDLSNFEYEFLNLGLHLNYEEEQNVEKFNVPVGLRTSFYYVAIFTILIASLFAFIIIKELIFFDKSKKN